MPRLPITALACVALAFGGAFVAGCGDDESDSASTPPPAAEAAPDATLTTESPDASGDVVEVGMKDIKFVPEKIEAKVGQRIVWTNSDGNIPHTVTATDGADFDSKTMNGGETFEFTPDKAGTIKYTCTIHSNQDGEITVTE